jgi:hypothetical protein
MAKGRPLPTQQRPWIRFSGSTARQIAFKRHVHQWGEESRGDRSGNWREPPVEVPFRAEGFPSRTFPPIGEGSNPTPAALKRVAARGDDAAFLAPAEQT